MTYEQEATSLMQMPKFIAAKNTYMAHILEIREEMQRTGQLPSQRVMTQNSKLLKALRETTGLREYKKTWKIIEQRLIEEAK